jgi:hypothetical protein
MHADNVFYLCNLGKTTAKVNIADQILTTVVSNYKTTLVNCGVDLEDPTIAFDIATIQFLLSGMAHRSQGESHPSQSILNTLRHNLLGV